MAGRAVQVQVFQMPDMVDRLNAAFGRRYRIEGEIGDPGMATVYEARDLRQERRVAIKVLRPEIAAAVGAERFLAEIRTTANLRHPHILPLFDSGDADGLLYCVMPLVQGGTLRDRLERDGPLPIDDALRVLEEVAEALTYAHERGVVHRDVKPANILFDAGHALAADFGIARALNAAGDDRLTKTGFAIGTPTYMSPGQATGEEEAGSARAGRAGKMLEWLEISFDRRGQGMPYIGVAPYLEPFHEDPGFRDVVRRMGLSIVTAPIPPSRETGGP